MTVPGGTFPAFGARELADPAVDAGTGAAAEGRLVVLLLPGVPPASLPSPAASPPMARLPAATAAVTTVRSTTSRRRTSGVADADRCSCRRSAAARLRAHSGIAASSDRTELEPARSKGVQANAN